MTMKLAVMGAANRNGEFVANFAAERTQLREPKMVRIAGLQSADEAWLQRDEVADRPASRTTPIPQTNGPAP